VDIRLVKWKRRGYSLAQRISMNQPSEVFDSSSFQAISYPILRPVAEISMSEEF
jgi:hypothetical protein